MVRSTSDSECVSNHEEKKMAWSNFKQPRESARIV
jgi:hypothetical protein